MFGLKIGSVELKNPVIVTSGEHGRDGDTIIKVAASGVGAITTKSIVPFPVPDPLPCYATMRSMRGLLYIRCHSSERHCGYR